MPQRPEGVQVQGEEAVAENDYTVKIDAVGLQQGNSPHGFDPGTEYCYRFRRGGEAFSPVGYFKTAPAADSAADVKAVYDGDQDSTGGSPGPFHGPFTALGQANLADGDFYVANGDNIYSDSHHRTGPGCDAGRVPRHVQRSPHVHGPD